jgi:hypothetical protein
MRPHDPLLVLVWLGKTWNDVVKDDQNGEGAMVGPNEKGQIWMIDVCTKIIGMASGNVIWQI